ncbi:MAG: hypothetical protein Q9159_001611, partial [Coniocarpon cinnabarinum]
PKVASVLPAIWPVSSGPSQAEHGSPEDARGSDGWMDGWIMSREVVGTVSIDCCSRVEFTVPHAALLMHRVHLTIRSRNASICVIDRLMDAPRVALVGILEIKDNMHEQWLSWGGRKVR